MEDSTCWQFRLHYNQNLKSVCGNESIPNKLLAVNHPTYVGVSRACLSCYGKMVFDCGERPSFNYSQNVR